MGINITAWKLNGIEEIEDQYPDCLYKYFKKERLPDWDSCRFSGDKDLWMTEDLEWESRNEGDDDTGSFNETYCRPKDLGKASDWVVQNIYIGNQQRWLNLFKQMESDKDIYLTCSW